jgi:hypothetical protein
MTLIVADLEGVLITDPIGLTVLFDSVGKPFFLERIAGFVTKSTQSGLIL